MGRLEGFVVGTGMGWVDWRGLWWVLGWVGRLEGFVVGAGMGG